MASWNIVTVLLTGSVVTFAQNQSCLVEELRSKTLKPCVFPFEFNNQVFDSCTNFTDPDEKLWCSTEVDSKGVHVGDKDAWGYCDIINPACNVKEEGASTEGPVPEVIDTNDSLGTWKPKRGDCGRRIGNEFIFNGETANPGEFPYIALIGYHHNTLGVIYTCGGALINRWYVITAAHCINSGKNSRQPTHVILGEHIIDFESKQDCSDGKCLPPIQNVSVEYVTFHEGWIPSKPDHGNDIALIRLSHPAKLYYDDSPSQSSVVPICIPWNPTDPGFELAVGFRTSIMGWGQVTNDRGETLKNFKDFNAPTRTLQKAIVPITSTEACLKNLTSNFNETRQICAGGEGSVDSCNGDNGGPLAFQTNAQEPWYLVGIVSVGSRVCGEGKPAIYTKIVSYLKWITENLKQ